MGFSRRLITAGAVAAAGLAIGTFGRDTVPVVVQARAAQESLAAAAPSTVTAAGITLRSVSVDLPTSDRMFAGADADAINNNCLACHSAGMVLNQPGFGQAVWQQEVEKMRAQFKAPVDEADVPAIVAYLVSHKGPK
jgi:hypothetical protein